MASKRLKGTDAVEYAERHGLDEVQSYTSPVEEGGLVSLEKAREICREDDSLVYLDVEVPRAEAVGLWLDAALDPDAQDALIARALLTVVDCHI